MTKLKNMLKIGHAKRPLSVQLSIAVFLIIIIVTLGGAYVFYETSRDLVLESNKHHLHNKNEQIKVVLNAFYKENFEEDVLINQLPVLRKINTQLVGGQSVDISSELRDFKEQANHLLRTKIHYNSIKYINIDEQRNFISIVKKTSGIELEYNSELKTLQDISSYLKLFNLNKKKITFSNITKKIAKDRDLDNELVFELVLPVWSDAQKKIIGLVIIEVNFQSIIQVIDRVGLQEVNLILIDEKNLVLYDSRSNQSNVYFENKGHKYSLESKKLKWKSINSILNNPVFVNVNSSNIRSESIKGIYQEFKNNLNEERHHFKWLVYSKEDKSIEVLEKISNQYFMLVTLLACIAFLLTLLIVRQMIKPLNHVISLVSELETTDTQAELPIQANNEIGVLARSLYNMLVLKKFKDKQVNDYRFSLDQHAIVSAIDIDGKIIFANSKFEKISGKNKNELIGTKHRTYYSENHEKGYFKKMYDVLNAGNVWHGQICFTAKNSHLYWLDTTVVPLSSDDGITEQFMFIGTDITKEKCALTALKESELRFEMSRAVSNDGIWDLDILNDTVFFDEHYYTMAGYQVNEYKAELGEWECRVHPNDLAGVQLKFNQYLSGNSDEYEAEFRFLRKDNHYMWIRAKGKVVTFNDNNQPVRMIGTHQDITSRKESENRIIEAKERAERAVQSKSEFFASMSHEIRTPMNGVLGMIGLMMRTKLNEQQKHYATLARSSADSLLAIIDDILDLSKIEAGKIELEIIDFNLREQLGIFAESMAYRAQDKGLEIILDVSGIEHSMVKGDPSRLSQILSNLIGNAIKFTETGEILVKANLVADTSDRWVFHCEVSDSGMGIPENKVPTLFDSYSQVDSSTTRKFGGTGLGLAIVKQLCRLMNGKVDVKSVFGQGAQFIFELQMGVSELSELVVPEHDITSKKILVVDDNVTNLAVIVGQLRHWGAIVSSAKNADDALKILSEKYSQKEDYFDLAILDMGMPEMDGVELGEIIRNNKNYDRLKLVMMTSMAGSGDLNKFKNVGFSAYFPKPAITSDLFHALQLLVEDNSTLEECDDGTEIYNLPNITTTNLFNNAQILLVEDNQVNQEVALGILESMGVSVDLAENGLEAIKQLKNNDANYGLVLMDCQMPEMDGYEATINIRASKHEIKNSEVPIIAMTANALKGDRQKCLEVGMNDYLSKPVDPNALEQILRNWLPKKQQDHHLKFFNNTTKLSSKVNMKLMNENTNRISDLKKNSNMLIKSIKEKNSSSKEIITEFSERTWDKTSMMTRIRNNEKLASKLIKLFLNDLPELSEALITSVEKGELNDIIAHSHRIKGSSANLSALALSKITSIIEQSARNNDLNEVEQQIKEFVSQVKKLTEVLQKEINNDNSEQAL